MINSQKRTRKIIKKAIKKVIEILSPTFGPNGRNVIIVKNGIAHCSNDGATIIKNIKTEDADVNTIIEIISDCALTTDEEVGDGTTSTALIACEMIKEAFKRRIKNYHQFLLGINDCCCEAKKMLNSFSKKELDEDDYYQIALQATNDESLATTIFNGYKTINFSGLMYTAETNRQQTSVEVINSFIINGALHSLFFTNDDIVGIDYPSVVLIDYELDDEVTLDEISELTNNSLVLIVDSITSEIINDIILINKKRAMPIIAISSGEMGLQRAMLYKDLEVLCGSDVLHPRDKVTEKNIGSLEKIIIGSRISLFPLASNQQRIDEHLYSLNNKIENIKDSYQIYLHNLRISRLDKNVAIINVGGATNQEIIYKRYKLDDGINALLHCKEEGVIDGAGRSLKKVSRLLKNKQSNYRRSDYKNGRKCFFNSILVLFKVLAYNSSISSYKGKRNISYSILDPTSVVNAVLKNATSIATLLIETSAMLKIDNSFGEIEKFK